MTSKAIMVLAALSAILASGCCKGCSAISGIVKEIAGPDDAEGERLVKERVNKNDKLRKQICGVDTKELVDLVVKKTPHGYSIQGTPIEKPLPKPSTSKVDGGVPQGPIVDPKKALVCTAVVSAMWDAKDGPSGTIWSVQRLDVDEVTTPGAAYKRPVSSSWD